MAKVTWKHGQPYAARVLGKRDGFSQEYRWEPANQHTVEVAAEDVDRFQALPEDAKEFVIEVEQPAPATKGGK